MNASQDTLVRLARLTDAPAIATIYNQGIAERIATFETEFRTPEVIAVQLAEKGDKYPTVVIERAEFRVVGVYKRHGKLDGIWRDCVIVEKLLDDHEA